MNALEKVSSWIEFNENFGIIGSIYIFKVYILKFMSTVQSKKKNNGSMN